LFLLTNAILSNAKTDLYSESTLLIDANTTQTVTNPCQQYVYELNFKPVNITINNVNGVDFIFYSDKDFYADCNNGLDNLKEQCLFNSDDGEALICGGGNMSSSDSLQISMNYCLENFFLSM